MATNENSSKKPRTVPMGFSVEGKLPPQAIELEGAVLGALMLDKEAFNEVCAILEAHHFYKEAHSLIFEAMWSLFRKAEPIDLLSVSQELRRNGNMDLVGGAGYITGLTSRLSSAANVEYHSRIVREKFLQREMIRIATNILKLAYDETTDAFELIDSAETELFKLTNNLGQQNTTIVGDAFQELVDRIENFNPDTDTLGTSTGIIELDKAIGGLIAPNLYTIGGSTGMGKTSLALNIAKYVSIDLKKSVLFVSYEMSKMQLIVKVVSDELGIENTKINENDKALLQFLLRNDIREKFSEGQLHIEDTGSLNIAGVRALAKRLKSKYGLDGLVIDYLQIMPALPNNKSNREQDIAENSRGLKRICKELNMWCLDLAQLNREAGKGNDNEPRLVHLRESGSIEQDSDVVVFPYRPEYYGHPQFSDGSSTEGMADLIIAKNRFGPLKHVRVRFIKSLTRFEDVDKQQLYIPQKTHNAPPDDSAMF